MEQTSKSSSNLLVQNQSFLNLKSLDALRGLLAVYVLAGHCRWLLWIGYSNWSQQPHPIWQKFIVLFSSILRYGHEAVIVFFVLSGFFIHLRISKQLTEKFSFEHNLGQFIRRRFHRLVPPYVFALILTVMFDVVGMVLYPTLYQATTGDALLDNNFTRKGYSLESVLPALLLLPSSLGQDFGSNGPFWSLAYEIVYYAIYPLWLVLRKQSAVVAYTSGLIVAIVSSELLPSYFIGKVLSHYPIWLCGAAMAELFIKRNKIHLLKSTFMWLPILVCLIVAFIGLHFPDLDNIKLFLNAVLGSSIVLAVLKLPNSIWQSSFHKLFERLGMRSYTIYICHFPMVALVSAWVIETQGSRPIHGWLALSGFLGSLLLCNFCFYLCENRFLHARIKLNSQN